MLLDRGREPVSRLLHPYAVDSQLGERVSGVPTMLGMVVVGHPRYVVTGIRSGERLIRLSNRLQRRIDITQPAVSTSHGGEQHGLLCRREPVAANEPQLRKGQGAFGVTNPDRLSRAPRQRLRAKMPVTAVLGTCGGKGQNPIGELVLMGVEQQSAGGDTELTDRREQLGPKPLRARQLQQVRRAAHLRRDGMTDLLAPVRMRPRAEELPRRAQASDICLSDRRPRSQTFQLARDPIERCTHPNGTDRTEGLQELAAVRRWRMPAARRARRIRCLRLCEPSLGGVVCPGQGRVEDCLHMWSWLAGRAGLFPFGNRAVRDAEMVSELAQAHAQCDYAQSPCIRSLPRIHLGIEPGSSDEGEHLGGGRAAAGRFSGLRSWGGLRVPRGVERVSIHAVGVLGSIQQPNRDGVSMSSAARRPRPGRPRHIPEIDSKLSPRDQILDVCARLFTQYGYAATSTRDIADAVGIRQASLYYHFAGKPQILEELLARTVRPTLDQIDRIEALAEEHGAASALYGLVMIDTRTLADAPHNTGRLPSLPEVISLEESKPYSLIYRDLVSAYARLGARIAGLDVDGVLLEHLVSVVVTWRANGDPVNDATCHMVAKTVLRSCGATDDEIKIASAVAWSELTGPGE